MLFVKMEAIRNVNIHLQNGARKKTGENESPWHFLHMHNYFVFLYLRQNILQYYERKTFL